MKGETPVIQATERRTFVHGRDRVGREPSARQPQLHGARRAGARRERHQRQRDVSDGGGGDTNVMMDGVSTMDTGSNRPLLADERRVDRRSEGARPRTIRPSTDGRAACRSPRSPRAAPTGSAARSTTWSATPTGTPTARRTASTAIPRRSRRSATGAFRSAARSASPAAATSSSSSTRRSSSRAPAATTSCRYRMPTAARAAGRLLADDRQQRQPYPYIKRSAHHRRLRRGQSRPACFADGGVLGKIPANRLYQTGLNILNMFPMPTIDNVPAGSGLQLRDHAAGREILLAGSRRPPRLSGHRSRCARHSSTRAGAAAQSGHQRLHARLQRHEDAAPGRQLVAAHGQLQPDADDVPRGDVRSQPERARRAARSRSRTGPSFCTAAVPMNAGVQSWQRRARRPAAAVSRRERAQPATTTRTRR